VHIKSGALTGPKVILGHVFGATSLTLIARMDRCGIHESPHTKFIARAHLTTGPNRLFLSARRHHPAAQA